MKKPLHLFFFLSLFAIETSIQAQVPDIEWQKSFGGSSTDFPASIKQTSDGGYIIGGHSYSANGDISANYGGPDYWIVKLDNTGGLEWEKNFGGSDFDLANSIQQTSDGGYIVAGYSKSTDHDLSGNFGLNDCWIIKLNSDGTLNWQKSFGGSGVDNAHSIQQTADGGFIVAAITNSLDGDVSSSHGDFDL